MTPLAWQQAPPQPGGAFPGGVAPRPGPQGMPPPELEWWQNPAVIAVLVGVALFVLVFGLFSLITAVQARRRGYPVISWLLAGLLGNPIFLLILLGVMPDFRRRKLRQKEAKDLRRRLRELEPEVEEPGPPREPPAARAARRRRDVSVGDEQTRAPERSIGDEVTRDVPERSLGDEETRP